MLDWNAKLKRFVGQAKESDCNERLGSKLDPNYSHRLPFKKGGSVFEETSSPLEKQKGKQPKGILAISIGIGTPKKKNTKNKMSKNECFAEGGLANIKPTNAQNLEGVMWADKQQNQNHPFLGQKIKNLAQNFKTPNIRSL